MTPILWLALFGLWTYACWRFASALARRFAPIRWCVPVASTVGVVLLAMPVADEIVGGLQFSRLCASAVLHTAVKDARGRVARYSGAPVDARLPGTAIPILFSHIEYRDATTGQLIASYDRFIAKGGWLVRTLNISSDNSPLILSNPSCSGEKGPTSLPRQLGFQVIN
jgi:hypothetical protein